MKIANTYYFLLSFVVTSAIILNLTPLFYKWQVVSIAADTIEVRRSNKTLKVRLCGVEVPPTFQKTSREYLQNILDKKSVKLSFVDNSSVEVFLGKDEKLINKSMLMDGMAKYNSDLCPSQSILRTAQEIAKWQKIGVWSSESQGL